MQCYIPKAVSMRNIIDLGAFLLLLLFQAVVAISLTQQQICFLFYFTKTKGNCSLAMKKHVNDLQLLNLSLISTSQATIHC